MLDFYRILIVRPPSDRTPALKIIEKSLSACLLLNRSFKVMSFKAESLQAGKKYRYLVEEGDILYRHNNHARNDHGNALFFPNVRDGHNVYSHAPYVQHCSGYDFDCANDDLH